MNNLEKKLSKIKDFNKYEKVVQAIPSTLENKDLIEKLAISNMSLVREAIARKENLPFEVIDILLNDKSPIIINHLLHNKDVLNRLTTIQVLKIIDTQNVTLLKLLGIAIEYLKNCDIDIVLDKLCNHPDPVVRLHVLYNIYAIPKKYVEKLLNDTDETVQKKVESHYKSRCEFSTCVD